MADVSIGGELSPRLHAKRDSIVYSHGWSDGSRTEEMEKTFSRNPSADGEWWNFFFFFSSIKENDDFRIISRMKLEGSVSSFPRDRSTKFIRRCRKFVVRWKSRIEKRIFARNDRWKSEIADLSKMVCSTLSTSATFHFSNLSSLSWRGFFFFLFDSKRVAKGFQNFRIARELRDVIVNVNIFVEIRGNIASNRKGESKTREEKGKKGNKNK